MDEGSRKLEKLKELVGKLKAPSYPPEVVEDWSLRRFLEATGDTNPLWTDSAYAKKTRWGAPITPPTFVEMYSATFRMWRRMAAPASFLDPPFNYNFGAGEDYHFFLPVRPGDEISCSAGLGDVVERRGSSGGRLAIIRYDKEYRNQRGELVARTFLTQVSVENRSHRDAAAASAPPKTSRPLVEKPKGQVCFEDVETGNHIPPLMKTFDVTTLARWMHGMGFCAPLHYDWQYITVEAGLPNLIVQGPLSNSYMVRMITDWIGGWGVLKRFNTEFRGVVLINLPITFNGRVTDRYVKDGENCVELQVWTEHPEGWVLTRGKAVVTLPARSEIPSP